MIFLRRHCIISVSALALCIVLGASEVFAWGRTYRPNKSGQTTYSSRTRHGSIRHVKVPEGRTRYGYPSYYGSIRYGRPTYAYREAPIDRGSEKPTSYSIQTSKLWGQYVEGREHAKSDNVVRPAASGPHGERAGVIKSGTYSGRRYYHRRPANHEVVNLSEKKYYFWDDAFYRRTYHNNTVVYVNVPPPVGAIVNKLPLDARKLDVDGQAYFVSGNTYYIQGKSGEEIAYKVVDSP